MPNNFQKKLAILECYMRLFALHAHHLVFPVFLDISKVGVYWYLIVALNYILLMTISTEQLYICETANLVIFFCEIFL